MPTYEYKCSNCGHMLEELQSMSAEPLRTCPNCKKDTLKRGLGGGAATIFKGQGFYLTDYKKSRGNSKGEEKKSADDSKSATSKDSPKTDTPKKDSGDSSNQSSPPPDKKS